MYPQREIFASSSCSSFLEHHYPAVEIHSIFCPSFHDRNFLKDFEGPPRILTAEVILH